MMSHLCFHNQVTFEQTVGSSCDLNAHATCQYKISDICIFSFLP